MPNMLANDKAIILLIKFLKLIEIRVKKKNKREKNRVRLEKQID